MLRVSSSLSLGLSIGSEGEMNGGGVMSYAPGVDRWQTHTSSSLAVADNIECCLIEHRASPHRRRRTPGPGSAAARRQSCVVAAAPSPLIDRSRAYVQGCKPSEYITQRTGGMRGSRPATRRHASWNEATLRRQTAQNYRNLQSTEARTRSQFSVNCYPASLMGPVHLSLSYANVFISSVCPSSPSFYFFFFPDDFCRTTIVFIHENGRTMSSIS